jgi:hypothetical protein
MHGRRTLEIHVSREAHAVELPDLRPQPSVQLRQRRLPSLLETSRTYHQHLPTALRSAFVQLFQTTGAFGLRSRPDITLRDH